MAFPRYFQQFPDLNYALKMNKAGVSKYIKIKDYFKLLTVRSDIYREDTLYTKYVIKDGMRPDEISYEIYQDEQFYWIVLQINDIVDYYNQWPLSENELKNYVYDKYGGASGAGGIHHYETVRTEDTATPPNLMLPGNLTVPKNYIFRYPTYPGSTIELSTTPVEVTNYTYERRLNEEKSQIFILDPKYVFDYDREVRNYAKKLPDTESFVAIDDLGSIY